MSILDQAAGKARLHEQASRRGPCVALRARHLRRASETSGVARVSIENVSRVFHGPRGEGIAALSGVTLTIESGEMLAVVGPSGSGKTTLLRLIAGLEQPSEGTVKIDGQVMNGVPPKDRNVAMVFQNPALFPHLTVFENLALGLRLRHVPKPERQQRVREVAELLGLGTCLERMPAALSGGERQRVAFGRALVRRPKVFLLDEPLSQLDAPLRAQLRGEIASLQARLGATMMYVTHDQAEAMTLGQRVAVLRAGALQQVAAPNELQRRPANAFVAEFMSAALPR